MNLAKGERALVSARTADGGWAVGTDRALHLPDGVVLGWHEVDQARWVGDDGTLEVLTLPEGSAPARTYHVLLGDPGQLPELVRERVTSSIVVSERVTLPGNVRARIMARRVPDGEGVRWSVIYEDGVMPGDAQLQEATRAAVARLQMRLGV